MSEFFRLHAEFLELQDDLAAQIQFFELDVSLERELVDVRDTFGQDAVGIALERLTSSELSVRERFKECWELADSAIDAGYPGIAYPCAASTRNGEWNLVLFGDGRGGWSVVSVASAAVPVVRPQDVRIVPA
jgi:hypothetical protein